MIVKTLTVGPLQANCYLVADEGSHKVAIIDPGGEGENIRSVIEREHWKPVALINTHGHIDHIGANAFLKENYAIPLMIHSEDARFLSDSSLNLKMPGLEPVISPPPDRRLSDGDEITIGSLNLKVVSTPGHSLGGVCLLVQQPEEPDIIFTGDTLFAGGVGRTDFPGGSMRQLMHSIKTKLLPLPDETIIYPGHGPPSTIGEEKLTNPFLISPGGN